MKKFISLLMSFVIMLSFTTGMSMSAFASEKYVKSFDLNPAKPYTVYNGAYNDYDEEGDGSYYLYNFNNDDELVLYYSDNSTEKFYYSLNDDCFSNENRFVAISKYNFYFDGLGETAFTVELNDFGLKKEIPITVVENPYKSFEITPTPFEVYGDESIDTYEPRFYSGCSLKVEFADNKKDTYNWVGGDLFIDESDNCLWASILCFDEAETSTKCKIYTISDEGIVTPLGCIKVPVIISENPVETFDIVPVKNYKISGDSIDDSENGWMCDLPNFNDGDIINLKYTSGNTDKFVYTNDNFINSKGEILDVEFSEVEPAKPGETTTGKIALIKYNKFRSVSVKILSKTTQGGTDPTPTPGGDSGNIGGSTGGVGGFTPAPTPEDTDKKDEEKKPETKPAQPIAPSDTTEKPASVKVNKAQAKKKALVVYWNRIANVSGYQIQVATDKKFKKNKKTITVAKQNASKKTVKKLKAKKKYFVRVRAYKIVDGKKSYGKWSKIKSVKTK